MNRKNFSRITLLLLIGIIIGILISQFIIPELENFLFSQMESRQRAVPLETPGVETKTEILCQTPGKGKTIEVDVSEQKLRMCENGKAIKEMSISSGKPETPTPTGNSRVINKSLMIYSKNTGCWLPFWVGFSQDGQYGFHEVPICVKDEGRTSLERVGQPASLGCVRLDIKDAETFYKWAEAETKVVIY
jgi:lipoprotein-anchoring transpeptidase ErfK/SrfK